MCPESRSLNKELQRRTAGKAGWWYKALPAGIAPGRAATAASTACGASAAADGGGTGWALRVANPGPGLLGPTRPGPGPPGTRQSQRQAGRGPGGGGARASEFGPGPGRRSASPECWRHGAREASECRELETL